MFPQSHTPAVFLKFRLLIRGYSFDDAPFYVHVVMTGRKWEIYSVLCQLKGFKLLSCVIHLDFKKILF